MSFRHFRHYFHLLLATSAATSRATIDPACRTSDGQEKQGEDRTLGSRVMKEMSPQKTKIVEGIISHEFVEWCRRCVDGMRLCSKETPLQMPSTELLVWKATMSRKEKG